MGLAQSINSRRHLDETSSTHRSSFTAKSESNHEKQINENNYYYWMSGKWIIVTRRLGARGQRFPLLVFALRYLCTHFFEITWPTMLTERRLRTNSITRASTIRKKKNPHKKILPIFPCGHNDRQPHQKCNLPHNTRGRYL